MNPSDHEMRLQRALLSLDGLSVGDAFGECFFGNPRIAEQRIRRREVPPPPWEYTDDTAMALSIVRCLRRRGRIESDELAKAFAQEYGRDPHRGYGGMAHQILQAINRGTPWRVAAGKAFDGQGSCGNGGATTVEEAFAYCEARTKAHYENFPVGLFVPRARRPYVYALYAFARAADDFADEPIYEGVRQQKLDQWEALVDAAYRGEAEGPIFVALSETVVFAPAAATAT